MEILKLITRMKNKNCGELNLNNINENVTLSGWVSTVRDLGGILFIELRDRSGFFQLVANPQINPEVHKIFEKVRSEYVITVKGKISRRPEETYNEKYPTGQVEMYPESVEILSEAKVLPFVLGDENVSEDVRLKYRYLDIRNEKMLHNLTVRHNIVQAVRNYLNNQDFLEVETPILIKTTPEGARDYLVPSRVQEGQIIPKNISALADVRTFKVTETNDTFVKQGVNGFFKSVYSKLKDETSKLNRMFGKADINEHEVSPELIKKLTNRININEPTPPSYIKFVSENKVFKD